MSNVNIYQNFIIIATHKTFSKIFSFVRKFNANILRSGIISLYFVLFVSLHSCSNAGPRVSDETPTRGDIKISVDESFQPIIDSEVYTFTSLYAERQGKTHVQTGI